MPGVFTLPGTWQLAWVNQETPALPQPAIEYVIDGDREYRQLEAQLNDANERNDGHAIASIHGKLDAIDAWTVRSRAASLLHGLGFSNDQLERPVSDFSGGWRMRLNLAQALICRSDFTAARRTDQPPRSGCRYLAGKMAEELSGHPDSDLPRSRFS
ncbi:glutathione ABC transporter ATP-binding protein [Salmonella enterica subsp. enterica]|uniref:Glutathione ABC transporter ATP-binding protein n=1 Tax=Salmonella enterica I TaxID=59201 RepID=A0A3S4IG21_SALET|nr:glutathione ABC transporter ATP-binding protein [Salmonella enterica subsp. enterica]